MNPYGNCYKCGRFLTLVEYQIDCYVKEFDFYCVRCGATLPKDVHERLELGQYGDVEA